jgi:hypothetical protein
MILQGFTESMKVDGCLTPTIQSNAPADSATR